MSNWNPGDPFLAMDTEANRFCGFTTSTTGYITCILGDQVGFFIDLTARGAQRIEASCDLGTFSHNFIPHPNRSNCPGFTTAGLAAARYPKDLKAARK